MSYMEELFFRELFEKQGDILLLMMKRKYFLLVPPTKCITTNMLTTQFYENHCFYLCEYDDRTYLNLLGKVLELNNNTFQTHLGFKRLMYFNIIDESIMETMPNVQIIHIDNIIDESMYQTVISSSASIYKKEMLRKCPSKEEYLGLFDNLLAKHNELTDLVMKLTETIDKLQNNYVLIKNHIITYSKHFRELGSEYRNYLASRLIKFKVDDGFNLIIYELAESLIFNKIYPFIYFNIKNFNFEEETKLKNTFNEAKKDFTFTTYNVDSILYSCKFNLALQELRKLPFLSAPFEKLAALTSTYNFVVKEINDIVSEKNKQKKVKAQITANELVPIWIYLVIYGDVENLLTEINIMQDFMLKDSSLMNESGYHLINLITAVESFKTKENDQINYTITPSFVISPKSNFDSLAYENIRSTSFASTSSTRSESVKIHTKLNILKK